jgi:hypothetical protein
VLNGHGDEENLRSNDSREVHDWSEWREIPGYDVDDGEANLHTTTTTSTAHTLEPDWDVINEIRWNRERGGIQVGRIAHIHGHQDRQKRYHELSLQAQLNVDADALAREYQTLHGHSRSTVLRLPHSGAILHLPQGTCTAQIPRALRWAEHEQPLAQYSFPKLSNCSS